MNNSVFGKAMENSLKRTDVKLCCKYEQIKKLIAKPNFRLRTVFNDNLVNVHMNKIKILFNKLVCVRMYYIRFF